MNKRIALLSLIAIFLLSGCSWNKTEISNSSNDGRMTLLYNDGFCTIYQDNETGVQYFSRADSGSCVMVDANGDPYTGRN